MAGKRGTFGIMLASLICAASMSLSGISYIQDRADQSRYERMMDGMPSESELREAASDGSAVRHPNHADEGTSAYLWPDIVIGFVKVNGTSIDYPVIGSANEEDERWALRHNVWGDYSDMGSVFLDHTCSLGSRNVVMYGHHMVWGYGMFSELRLAWEQGVFDGLGDAYVTERSTGHVTDMRPLCAISTDKYNTLVRQSDFEDDEAFRSWLGRLVDSSSSRSPDADGLIAAARRSLVLVTCSSSHMDRPERTVVVFAG